MSIDGAPAGSQTRTVQLRATRDVPFVVVGERGPEYLGWVFSAFVTEDAPWIDALLGEAFKGRDIRPLGYQRGPDDVIAQVAVVYQYLRSRGIRYSSITTGSGEGQRVASQTVRFPSDSIRSSQANCIDGTVLMASILRKIDIEAYIITGPGHAMLGFSTKPKPANDQELLQNLVVVETTALGDADIGVAIKAGNAKFIDWYKNHRSHLSFGVIPVSAMRAVGVMPIAR
jgi:transglutaminase-like putative cysteine protease